MTLSAVMRLSCGHDLTVRKVREVPSVAWCKQCEGSSSVDRYVTDEPLKRADTGRTY